MQKSKYLTAFLITIGLYTSAQKIEVIDGIYFEGRKPFFGVYTDTSSTGKVFQTITLKNGKPDGQTKIYYPNGQLKEERYYKNGLRDSLWITWSESGGKIAKASFYNDLKDGNWMIWDEKGVKRYDMFYRKGEKIGTWKMWDESGALIQEKTYK